MKIWQSGLHYGESLIQSHFVIQWHKKRFIMGINFSKLRQTSKVFGTFLQLFYYYYQKVVFNLEFEPRLHISMVVQ
jgi:hypothetical protein